MALISIDAKKHMAHNLSKLRKNKITSRRQRYILSKTAKRKTDNLSYAISDEKRKFIQKSIAAKTRKMTIKAIILIIGIGSLVGVSGWYFLSSSF